MMLVTVFSTIERLLGFVYRIFLSRNLGAEGVGVYQVALSIVGLLMTLTASGIPITVSRIMTKHSAANTPEKSYGTVAAGVLLSLALSVPVVLALYLFPNAFNFLFADERSYAVLKIILPGIIITSVYAVIRGFLWGKRFFFSYSIIELTEEAVMLIAGVVLVSKATNLKSGIDGAATAVLISYIFSFISATMPGKETISDEVPSPTRNNSSEPTIIKSTTSSGSSPIGS